MSSQSQPELMHTPRAHVILSLVLFSCTFSAAFADTSEYREYEGDESFVILNSQGMKTRGTVEISGITAFDESTFSWSLEGLVTEAVFEGLKVLHTTEDILVLDDRHDGFWNWRFSVDLNLFDRCSCTLSVSQLDEQRAVVGSDNLAVFIGGDGVVMPQIGWALNNDRRISSGGLYFEAEVYEDPELNQSLRGAISVYDDKNPGLPGSMLVSDIVLESNEVEGHPSLRGFNYDVNISDEGDYRLSVYSDGTSPQAEIFGIDFLLDLTEPAVQISCPNEVPESTSELLIDGTHTSDQGSPDELEYNWVIQYPDGHFAAPLDEMYEQPDMIRFIPSESGTYNLTLRATDLAGHVGEVTHVLIVLNLAPIAEVLADGLHRTDGDVIVTDSNAETMIFDASNSTDSLNDLDELQYAWYLNGLLVSSEDMFNLSIGDIPTQATLEFIIKDNDGANDSVSLVLMNLDEEVRLLEEKAGTQSSFYTGLNLVLATGLICVILLLVVKRKTLEEDLPKWSRRKKP